MSDDTDIGILEDPIPLGKYYLLERISVGGMAEIYKAKAFGVEGFERVVAVKKILSKIAEDESFIEMFVDEAKIAGKLNHPNIAQIYDLGRVDASYYIALEYISGKDLKTLFDRTRRAAEAVDIPQICYICKKVCEGLEHAHDKTDSQGEPLNIVHRDVSPQNVLISFEGEVKIIDFGIAKAQGKTSQTQAGVLKGKFSYMSPEQVRGLDVDHRSDLFSLGIVLYEMLTLERLFLGESDFDTLEKIRNVEMSPPSLYNPNIPDQLEEIVLRALAKDPDDRFQSASEMAEELERFMREQGEYYGSKQLGAFMKETFEEEREREQEKLEYFRDLDLEPPDRRDEPGGGGDAGADRGLVWDEDEKETEIFDRSRDRPEGLPPEPVLPDSDPAGPAEEGSGSVEIVGPDDVVDVIDKGEESAADPTPAAGAGEVRDRSQTPGHAPTAPGRGGGPEEAAAEGGGETARVDRRSGGEVSETAPGESVAPEDGSGGSESGRWTWAAVAMVVLALAVFAWFGQRLLVGPGPDETSVTFDTTPSNVTIEVNGDAVYTGRTPYTLIFEPGDDPTEIAVSKEGYRTKRETRTFRTDQRYKVAWELSEAPDPEPKLASLEVETEPSGATIRIDGTRREGAAPLTAEDLEPGEHVVAASLEGRRDRDTTVELQPGQSASVTLELPPARSSASIQSRPDDAYFTVRPEEGDEVVASGRTPATVDELEPGNTYRLVVERDGYERWSQSFRIDQGETSVEVTPELEARETRSEQYASAGGGRPDRRGSSPESSGSGGPSPDNGAGSPDPREGDESATDRGRASESAASGSSESTEAPSSAESGSDGDPAASGSSESTEAPSSAESGSEGDPASESASTSDEEPEHGILNINSMPAARVKIDGKDIGLYTPLQNYQIPAGSHQIRLVNDQFGLDKTYRVTIEPGESKKILHKSEK